MCGNLMVEFQKIFVSNGHLEESDIKGKNPIFSKGLDNSALYNNTNMVFSNIDQSSRGGCFSVLMLFALIILILL